MKNMIIFFIRRPVTVLMIMAAVIMGSVLSLLSIPLDILPEILLPQVTIETSYPGMNANDIRSAVTIPLEDAMSSVKGLERIRNISRDGVSLINLDFRWETDPSNAAALVREAVDLVYPGLPHGISKPLVISGNIADEPHAIVAIRSKAGDNSFARNMAEYEMKARLRRLDGTGQVILLGGLTEEARIKFNPQRLVSRGFNGDEFVSLIAPEITDIPAGNAREGDRELTLVSQGRPQSIDELSSLILPTTTHPLAIRDIGVVEKEYAEQKSFFLFQNIEQTALEIYKRPGADPLKLSRDIKRVLKESSLDFERDIELVLVYDSSDLIIRGIRNLIFSIIIGASAVALILAFFIKNLKTSLFAALALPLSTAAAVIVLRISGRSLNSMSLAGIAMGIGLVSDVSVIILDLFSRNIKQGEKPDHIMLGKLTASVSNSSIAGTITNIVVFLPVIFLPGPLGVLFGDLAVSLITSVVTGWIYAQFFLPAMYLFFCNENAMHDNKLLLNKINLKNPEKVYKPLLMSAMRRPLLLVKCALIFGILSLILLLNRPAQFIIPEQTNEIEIVLDFPSGTSSKAIINNGLVYSKKLSDIGDIAIFFGRMGAEDDDINPRIDPNYRKERILFRCFLKQSIDRDAALRNIHDNLSELTANASGINDNFNIQISLGSPLDKTSKLLGLSSLFTLMVKGELEDINQRSEEIIIALESSLGPVLDSVNVRSSGTRPELRLILDQEVKSFLGISSDKIANAVYIATEGIISGSMEIDGRQLDIRVIGENNNFSQNNLESLPLAFQGSRERQMRHVFLGTLGQIERRETKAILARQDRSDVLYIDITPSPGKENDLNNFLSRNIKDFTRIDDSVFSRYRTVLIITLILVILLLYLTMAAQFESFKLPLIIMLSIPFGFIGSGPLLFLTGTGLNSGSILGLIVLFGLSVNNGIIIYEAGIENLNRGFSPALAVYKGALDRFRAMLISTLTTIFGLIPLLFSSGISQRSMAAAMLGGLLASAAFSIFIFPYILTVLFKRRQVEYE